MDRIPIPARTKIVELYFATNPVVLTQRTFWTEFPGRPYPCERTIKRLVDKFRNTGSLVDNDKGHSSRPFSARNPTNIQVVRDRLQQSPRKSTRRLSQEVGISRTSAGRVIHKRLNIVSLQDKNSPTTNRCKQKRKVRIPPNHFWKNWKQSGSSRPHFLQQWNPFSSKRTCQQTKHAILGT